MPTVADLYAAMVEADEAFSRALYDKYDDRAGDVRYQPNKQTPKIRALGEKFRVAAEAWNKAATEQRQRCSA